MTDQNKNLYDFSSLTQREDEPMFTPLPMIMEEANKQNPSAFAESRKISRLTGIPIEAVESDLDTSRAYAKSIEYDYNSLVTRSPVTGEFLSQYDNAVMGQNDVPVMERIEKLISDYNSFSEKVGAVARSLPAGIFQGTGMGTGGTGTFIDIGGRTLARAADFMLPEAADKFIWENPADKYLKYVDPAAFLRARGEGIQQIGQKVGPAKEDKNLATEISAGVGQMVGQVALYALAPELALPMMFAQGVDQQAQRQEDSGTYGTSVTSDMAVLLGGAVTLATERTGIDQMLERIPPNIRNEAARAIADVMIAGGIEGVQEVVENVTHSLIEKYSTNPDADLLEGAVDEGTIGFSVGAVVRALVLTAIPGKFGSAATSNQQNIQQGQQDQITLDRLNEFAESTKLRQLSPESFSEFITRVDGGRETQVYIDPAQLSLYLNEKANQGTPDAALILLAEQADEAMSLGTAVTIPVQDFATVIAGTEHYTALRDSMTLSAEAVPTFRQEQAKKETETYMSKLVEQAQENAVQYAEAQDFYNSIKQQLIDSGRVNQRNASVMAQVIPAWATVYSQRTGKSISEIYMESGLTVVGPETGKMTSLTQRVVDTVKGVLGVSTPVQLQQDEYQVPVRPEAVDSTGRPIARTEQELKNFNEWFGDSKVVDDQGRPMVVYHGTGADINQFRDDLNTAGEPASVESFRGMYFATSPDLANRYAGEGSVYPAYLNIQNPMPYEVENGGNQRGVGGYNADALFPGGFTGTREEIQKAIEAGYDGIIRGDEVIVFDPTQIKSAIGNKGTFDPNNPSILEQKGARGYYDPKNSTIRLTEASDLSTFLHEFAHFMFEMEKSLGGETWNEIGKWFKRNAVDVAAEANGYLVSENLPSGVESPSPKLFHDSLKNATSVNPNGASVWVGEESDYKDMRRYTLDGGLAGFAIERDGNLTGVFKHPDSSIQRALDTIVPMAIKLGATKLDAFDGFLTEQYAKYGFKEVRRVPFNPEMAPANWNTETMGTPDVVFMELDEEIRNEVTQNAAASGVQDADAVRTGNGVLAQQGRKTLEPTREKDGSLNGLPRNVGRFKAKHNPVVAAVAESYMKSRGLEYNPPNTYASVDPERASRIAQAYDEMKHDPQNPEVAAAYEAMIEETIAQYEAVIAAGLRVEFIDFAKQGDPYEESPRMAIDDIADNNHMWVFSTRDGFGSDDTFDPIDNPLLRETEFIISGQKALVNDLFRVVHDYFGHVKEGVGFRASGEENAWRAHSAMYSPLARKAMTVETRGQNSWVNYGPYGEQNRTASSAETHFADQKIGLLPDWVVTEGAGDTDVFLQAEDDPSSFDGPITEDDVARYVDEGTTGDQAKDKALYIATHEQFARGWEKYLMEGKAPSIELRNAFRTFARWLVDIYKKIRGTLNVNLDDEMRQVFDRLIATEEQIANAEARAKVEPLFTDAAMAGMTEEQYQKYLDKQKRVSETASETLRDKLIKQLTRQTEKWWRSERDDIAAERREELKNERVYLTIAALRDGKVKLDKATVKEMVGDQRISRRGNEFVTVPPQLRNMTEPGGTGIHPDEAAVMFGYSSGSELLNDIMTSPSLNKAAEDFAQADMLRRYGDILNDGSIQQEADEALQNEEKGKLILDELKALNRRINVDKLNVRDMAEQKISQLSYRQINPQKYRTAEVRAAQEAASMLAAGNTEGAADAKMRQLMNFYLAKAAQDARAGIEKIQDDMNRYNRKSVREAVMKAENGYWEQIEKILDRFEFRKSATLKSVDSRNQDINTWAEDRINEDGDGIVLSTAVSNESYVTHWKNVPYTDLQGISDSVRNIEHVARYSNKIRSLGEARDFKEVVDTWTSSIKEKVKTVWKPQRTTTVEGKNDAKWANAQLTKIAYLASWLDGGERVGLSHDIIFQPFTDALNDEYQLYTEVATPVLEAIKNRSTADKKRHMRKIHIPEIKDAENDGNLMGHQILAVALNVGNQSNLKKLLLGEGWANKDDETTISLDNPKLQAVLRHMTKSDWDLVQLIWDQMEQLYPKLSEVHRRTTGLTPPKVEAATVNTPFGEYRGGYYPVKYDPARSHKAELNEQRMQAQVESMFSTDGSIQASVNASAVNARTGYYAPINLNIDIVPNHFQEVVHYITHHDAVREVNKLIRNKSVADAIKGALGPDEFAQLKPWLNDIAKDGKASVNKLFTDSIFQNLRFGYTLGVMGFKASTGIIQISGLSNATAEVGAENMMKAMRMILASPDDTQSATEFAFERSKVLSHRMKSMDREMRSVLESLQGKRGFWAATQEASMKHIAFVQTYMVDVPSWYAGYVKELERSGDEEKAIKYGDWVVEQIQGSGATKDLSAIMRSQSKATRLFTMFMTFFSSLWNQQRDLVRGAMGKQYSATTVAAKLMWMITVPVLFDMLLRGELDAPDDDDEDKRIQEMLTTTAMYSLGGVPVLRDIANGVVGDFGYSMTPVAQVLEAGVNGIPELLKRPFTDEEITKGMVKGSTQLVGAALGVPGVSQVWNTGEHLYQVLEEGEDLTVRELFFGPDRE